MHLSGAEGQRIHGALYGKVLGAVPANRAAFSVRFTSMSPEIETVLHRVIGKGPDSPGLAPAVATSQAPSVERLALQYAVSVARAASDDVLRKA
jgi:hypothetical protein